MTNNLTYHTAYAALEKLVSEIENDGIQLDILAEKISEANTLVSFCERQLRVIDTAVREGTAERINNSAKG